ncbi:hypothetical protein [Aliiglaciecola sp. LCG003]|uniref:hypothetical protein n=1 Tax=Aliiglaciecola sp. LCG003 TaxID=3053655 RepID=UPI00257408F6|nr:hypothetical protein [Aliiglaciecola sp. LCG003]WJG08201.1 hypothetical protein QR722_12720 [Aliiglaciecola sp. LCG003]
MADITHTNVAELTSAAHVLKTLLNIKFTRAKERHANAMGFSSSNHLLAEVKNTPVTRSFEQYIDNLKTELHKQHQLTLDDQQISQLREQLCN